MSEPSSALSFSPRHYTRTAFSAATKRPSSTPLTKCSPPMEDWDSRLQIGPITVLLLPPTHGFPVSRRRNQIHNTPGTPATISPKEVTKGGRGEERIKRSTVFPTHEHLAAWCTQSHKCSALKRKEDQGRLMSVCSPSAEWSIVEGSRSILPCTELPLPVRLWEANHDERTKRIRHARRQSTPVLVQLDFCQQRHVPRGLLRHGALRRPERGLRTGLRRGPQSQRKHIRGSEALQGTREWEAAAPSPPASR